MSIKNLNDKTRVSLITIKSCQFYFISMNIYTYIIIIEIINKLPTVVAVEFSLSLVCNYYFPSRDLLIV